MRRHHRDVEATIGFSTSRWESDGTDAAHPDTWAWIYMSKGGSANYLQCVDPDVDRLHDAGLRSATTPAAADYRQAGNLLVKAGCLVDVADVDDTIVGKGALSGFYHVPAIPWSYNLDTPANA